jgi:hypothetical protein
MKREFHLQNLCRWSELNDFPEVSDLKEGMDFRLPKYRREVFLRFYEFHLKYAAHPGGVYFAMPWLSKKFDLSKEQKLWIAFINGCSQNIITTWQIFEKFPSLEETKFEDLNNWWNEVHSKFKVGGGWDTDRKYFKIGRTGFPQSVKSYKDNVEKFGTQTEMFNSVCDTNDLGTNFKQTWDLVKNNFMSFGRLSTFSYLEYLRIQGLPLDCNDLFLEDIGGSRSHRNGVCKVLGRDDLDWWKEKVTYDQPTIEWLKKEANELFLEAKERINHNDVSLFTLESTLCCYKSWHRPNRRYPNVYMDMMRDRIEYAESQWGDKFQMFWDMRKDCLPKHLRIEDNPWDVGLRPAKQNHYRETGEVILMDKEWSCFKNSYEDTSIGSFMR